MYSSVFARPGPFKLREINSREKKKKRVERKLAQNRQNGLQSLENGAENKKTFNELQFCELKARGQRRMEGLVQADRK